MTIAATLPAPLARLVVPRRGASRSRFAALLRRELRRGRLTVTWPDGSTSDIEAAEPGPAGVLVLHRWRALARLAAGGGTGFAEAYQDGDWDSPDPATVVELAAVNQEAMQGAFGGGHAARLVGRLLHRLRANSRSGSRRNIAAHYDLGNDFYALWLDTGMTYSSAIFTPRTTTLADAQDEKYRRMLYMLEGRPGQHILEIGCGWGGFALFAARRGYRVTGITLSRRQLEWASARVAAAGMRGRVELRLVDYRDVRGTYDHIVSIEMIEAVGEAYWPAYFRRLDELLAPGGRVALQAITIADGLFERYRRRADFIQKHIFPGGMLPSPSMLAHHSRLAGFRTAASARHGVDYARTLAAWATSFRESWPDIAKLGYDERFRRTWELYLAYCEGGFRAGSIDLHQIALARG